MTTDTDLDAHRPHDELGRVLSALAAGDLAFVVTFVGRFGPALATTLAARGVAPEAVGPLVHEVAFDLAGRPLPDGPAWAAVEAAADRVLDQVESSRAAHPAARRAPVAPRTDHEPARALHLVDIENLAGGPQSIDRWFALSLRQLEAVAPQRDGDQVVMAADRSVWRRTAWDVDPGWRYLPGVGPDGADRALLGAADPDWVEERFQQIVVASGDHAFAPLVTELIRRGVDAVVVARPRRLARVLRATGADVRALPDLVGAPGSARPPAPSVAA